MTNHQSFDIGQFFNSNFFLGVAVFSSAFSSNKIFFGKRLHFYFIKLSYACQALNKKYLEYLEPFIL